MVPQQFLGGEISLQVSGEFSRQRAFQIARRLPGSPSAIWFVCGIDFLA
jgi:hypothetical protein